MLLDEIELVGSYSLLQRGRSYAELARWQGQAGGESYPGLVAIGTITDDFDSAVIGTDGKKDRDNVGARLMGRYEALAAHAENGMRLIEREGFPLKSPTDADVQGTMEKLRRIYSAAYSWDAPRVKERPAVRAIRTGCGTKSAPPSTSGTCYGSTRTPTRKP